MATAWRSPRIVPRSPKNGSAHDSAGDAILLQIDRPGTVLTLVSADRSGRTHPVTIETLTGSATAEHTAAPMVTFLRRSELPRLSLLNPSRARGRSVSAHSQQPVGTPTHPPSLLPVRRFLVPRMVDGHVLNLPVQGELACAGRRVAVYVDCQNARETDQRLACTLVRQLEQSGILASVEQLIHPLRDVDSDTCLTFVLGDIDDRVEGHSRIAGDEEISRTAPVRGCVRPDDWMLHPHDFSGDIIYLDRRLSPNENHAELLTHELAHAAICSAWRDAGCDRVQLPGWLNEAIAHTAERLLTTGQQNLGPRLRTFFDDPGHSPIIPNAGLSTVAMRRGGPRAAAATFVDVLMSEGMTLSQLARPNQSMLQFIQQQSGRRFDALLTRWAATVTAQTNMAVLPLASNTSQRQEIQGTAMLCLRPIRLPCHLRITAPSSARLSAVCVTE